MHTSGEHPYCILFAVRPSSKMRDRSSSQYIGLKIFCSKPDVFDLVITGYNPELIFNGLASIDCQYVRTDEDFEDLLRTGCKDGTCVELLVEFAGAHHKRSEFRDPATVPLVKLFTP